MSLEGRFKDLGLADVLQLISTGGRSGVLHCAAPLLGRWLRVGIDSGTIVHVEAGDLAGTPAVAGQLSLAMSADEPAGGPMSTSEARITLLEALRWTDGTFRFATVGSTPVLRTIRLQVDPILMDGAAHAPVWARIGVAIPSLRAVAAFAELDPSQLPELRLTAAQWEVLAQIDGQRDIVALGAALKRDPVDVAEQVFDLIKLGLVVLAENEGVRRRNPTPPLSHAAVAENDLQSGQLPRGVSVAVRQSGTSFSDTDPAHEGGVNGIPVDELERLLRENLPKAVICWTEALGFAKTADEADGLSARIDLANRLHTLLHDWHRHR